MTTHHLLTPHADRVTRRISITAAALVALAACVLSFRGLQMLGAQSGFGSLSALFPIALDGMMLIGIMLTLRCSLLHVSTKYGWSLTLIGVAASVAGNIAGSNVQSNQALITHGSVPLIYMLSLEALFLVIKRDVIRESAAEDAAERKAERAAATAERKEARALALLEPVVVAKQLRSNNSPVPGSQMAAVLTVLSQTPEASTAEIRAICGNSVSYNTISKARVRNQQPLRLVV